MYSTSAAAIAKRLRESQRHCISKTTEYVHCLILYLASITYQKPLKIRSMASLTIKYLKATKHYACELKFSYLSTSTFFFWNVYAATDCNPLRQQLMLVNHLVKDSEFVIKSHQKPYVLQLLQDVNLVREVHTCGAMRNTWHNARVWVDFFGGLH